MNFMIFWLSVISTKFQIQQKNIKLNNSALSLTIRFFDCITTSKTNNSFSFFKSDETLFHSNSPNVRRNSLLFSIRTFVESNRLINSDRMRDAIDLNFVRWIRFYDAWMSNFYLSINYKIGLKCYWLPFVPRSPTPHWVTKEAEYPFSSFI